MKDASETAPQPEFEVPIDVRAPMHLYNVPIGTACADEVSSRCSLIARVEVERIERENGPPRDAESTAEDARG